MDLELVHIWGHVSTTHFSSEFGLRHAKQSSGKSTDTALLQRTARHQAFPSARDFDDNSRDVEAWFDILEELYNP